MSSQITPEEVRDLFYQPPPTMSSIINIENVRDLFSRMQHITARKTLDLLKTKTYRYPNIRPYKHNAVNQNSSFMIGPERGFPYKIIACDAPSRFENESMFAFWMMNWNQNIRTICMVTEILDKAYRVKAEPYWDTWEYDPERRPLPIFRVECPDGLIVTQLSQVEGDFGTIIRKFQLRKDGECRTITQIHCSSWEDCSATSMSTLVGLIGMINQTQRQAGGNVCIHCSAGVGRTGTLIACLIANAKLPCFRSYEDIALFLREQRVESIQTFDQLRLFVQYFTDINSV